jgi:hypothetical protein
MASRFRDSRRRDSRAPGVWRGPLATADRSPVQHSAKGRELPGARLVSGLIVLGLSAVLFLLFSTDIFYVHSIAVGGLEGLTKEEVFALTDIANMHIFWVDPEAVRAAVLRSPTVASVRVEVGWPPQMVTLFIEERQPALVWEQAGVATWIDLQGRVMKLREDRPDLLRVRALSIAEAPLAPNVQLDSGVVTGALQLRTLLPGLTGLQYHPDKGLGFTDGRGWEAWFGIGTDMPEKLIIYEALVNNLGARGIQALEINVSNLHAPFYAVLRGR